MNIGQAGLRIWRAALSIKGRADVWAYGSLPRTVRDRRTSRLQTILQNKEKELLEVAVPSRGQTPGGSIRVLQVNTFENYGGAAKVAWRLHHAYNGIGHSSTILVRRRQTTDSRVIPTEGAREDKTFRTLCLSEGLQDWNYLSSFRLHELGPFREASVVHFHNLHGGYFNYLALPGLTRLKPSVWTLHDMQPLTGHCAHSLDCDRWMAGCGQCPMPQAYPPLKKDTSDLLWKKKREIFSHSRLDIVVPSRWLFDRVKKSILAEQRVHLIYNGIDQEVFRPYPKEAVRKRFGIPRDKVVLIVSSAGGMKNPFKGGHYLTEVLERLGRDIVCVSIGDKGKGPGIKGVHWIGTGHLDDEMEIARWYSAGDLFVYPSIADNCPLVVLEAMACGLPVISFKTGGIPELVKHGETGYLADYRDAEGLRKGIETFLDNGALIKSASRLARAEVEKNFTLKRMVDQYIALYEKVIVDWGKSEIAPLRSQ